MLPVGLKSVLLSEPLLPSYLELGLGIPEERGSQEPLK